AVPPVAAGPAPPARGGTPGTSPAAAVVSSPSGGAPSAAAATSTDRISSPAGPPRIRPAAPPRAARPFGLGVASSLSERWIGQRVFLGIGVVALLMAAGYLLKL